MAGLIPLPDGQAVRPEDVSAVKIEPFFGGAAWYVYIELKGHPRVTISADSKEDAVKIAAQITTAVNDAS